MSLFGGWGFDKTRSKTGSKTRSNLKFRASGNGTGKGSRKKLNKNQRKSQKFKNSASGSKHIKYAMRIIGGKSFSKRYFK